MKRTAFTLGLTLAVGIALGMMGIQVLLGAFLTPPALAQEKGKEASAEKGKATTTVLLENDKVRVQEIRFKPGDENTAVPSSNFRVVRALRGGTLMRTYDDGKTEKVEYKTGQVRMNEPSSVGFKAKNVGKTDIILYIVVLK